MEKTLDFGIQKTRYRLRDTEDYIEIDDGDINFPVRYKEATKKISEYFNNMRKEYGIEDIDSIGAIDTGDIEKDIDELEKADKFIKEQIDYIFSYNVSDVVFGEVSCLTVNKSGLSYYFEDFLNAILPLIEEEYKQRFDKIKLKTKKYIDNKGQHPANRR